MLKFQLFTVIALATSTSAFVPPNTAAKYPACFMSERDEIMENLELINLEQNAVDTTTTTQNPVVSSATEAALRMKSQSLPFMDRPTALDGTLAGDVGFDPLGFAKTKDDLIRYREAEIKHGRLAMLAAAGWPLSELFDKKIATALSLTPVLDASNRVPSLLNGGLGKISPAYWVGCLGAAALVDILGQLRMKDDKVDYLPGDYGLRLGYPNDKSGQDWMQLAEIKNGRLAMIAILGFAVQEFVTKQGVVDETPFFFKPFLETLQIRGNSGYIQ